ncbi:MAG: hydantoinase B/oxoprolinase family protein [Rhodobacteraceae bacterium]|nr:hydantoinase B/oxoprolinase family protein [Paracoccaceae bacterium]
MTLDLFRTEVIRQALQAAAEEMSVVVMHAARSPLLREAGDLSSTLTDARGELIAQGQDVPVHLGVMAYTVKEFLRHVPAGRLAPGDVWLLNLPEVGGNHLPDVKAIRPIFRDGAIVAFAVQLAHWADIGGTMPGSYFAAAEEVWQEGLRIPPLRVVAGGVPDAEKIALILANVRSPAEREGDLLAQVAATAVADQRLQELIDRVGVGDFLAALDRLHDLSEAAMRAAIRALPDGVHEGEDFLDDCGPGDAPVGVRVRVTIAGDTAEFDFSASDDAVPAPINTTRFVVGAAVFYCVRALAETPVHPNGGAYRPLTIRTRRGSILDPAGVEPVVGGNHETSQRCVDAIFRAFDPVLLPRLSAGGNASAGLLIFGGPRADGVWGTFYETHGGGEGARADRDGMPVVRVHLTNVMNTPVEVVEAEYGLVLERQALRRGSGGAGRHRGGDGMVRDYRVMTEPMRLTTMFERRVVPPYGLDGGAPGATFRVTLIRDGRAEELRGKGNYRLRRGDLVRVETPGGGGHGPPPAG